MLKRVLLSLLLSSLLNLGITILWVSSRSFWQYDWHVDGVIFLVWPLLVIYAFSALGAAVMLPFLGFLRKRNVDVWLGLGLAFMAAASLGFVMMLWAPKVALLGAVCALVTVACLRLVAPSLFLQAE